jgi:hypothetical protein
VPVGGKVQVQRGVERRAGRRRAQLGALEGVRGDPGRAGGGLARQLRRGDELVLVRQAQEEGGGWRRGARWWLVASGCASTATGRLFVFTSSPILRACTIGERSALRLSPSCAPGTTMPSIGASGGSGRVRPTSSASPVSMAVSALAAAPLRPMLGGDGGRIAREPKWGVRPVQGLVLPASAPALSGPAAPVISSARNFGLFKSRSASFSSPALRFAVSTESVLRGEEGPAAPRPLAATGVLAGAAAAAAMVRITLAGRPSRDRSSGTITDSTRSRPKLRSRPLRTCSGESAGSMSSTPGTPGRGMSGRFPI